MVLRPCVGGAERGIPQHMVGTVREWLLVGLGGGLGSILRLGIYRGVLLWRGPDWPWGTQAANLLGSFLLGFVALAFEGHRIAGVDARLVVGTGMMGGLTTYSTFNLETLRLAQEGHPFRAAAYVLSTLSLCLLGAAGGMALARAGR